MWTIFSVYLSLYNCVNRVILVIQQVFWLLGTSHKSCRVLCQILLEYSSEMVIKVCYLFPKLFVLSLGNYCNVLGCNGLERRLKNKCKTIWQRRQCISHKTKCRRINIIRRTFFEFFFFLTMFLWKNTFFNEITLCWL